MLRVGARKRDPWRPCSAWAPTAAPTQSVGARRRGRDPSDVDRPSQGVSRWASSRSRPAPTPRCCAGSPSGCSTTCAPSSACSPKGSSRAASAASAPSRRCSSSTPTATRRRWRWKSSARSTTRGSPPSWGCSTSSSISIRCRWAATACAAWSARSAICSRSSAPLPSGTAPRWLLVGILPTLDKSHLSLEAMTPKPRYRELNDAITRLRGGEFEFRLKGADELIVRHDNVMLEACNTSFQVHFQVGADEFARLYNIAQAVAAPVLAAAVNSPLLFGQRLWHETRIALFQQSVDTRDASSHVREQSPRVTLRPPLDRPLGHRDLPQDIARFRALLGADLDEDPFAELDAGRIAAAQGAAPAQRHGLPLEPPLLRHLRRQAAPADREPRAARRAHAARRGGQRRLLVRPDEGGGRGDRRRRQGDAVRFGGVELPRRRPPRPARPARLAGARPAAGPRPDLQAPAAARPPRPRRAGDRRRRRRPLPGGASRPGGQHAHRLPVDARLAGGDAGARARRQGRAASRPHRSAPAAPERRTGRSTRGRRRGSKRRVAGSSTTRASSSS